MTESFIRELNLAPVCLLCLNLLFFVAIIALWPETNKLKQDTCGILSFSAGSSRQTGVNGNQNRGSNRTVPQSQQVSV